MLNFETVKYFGHEEYEAIKFHEVLQTYERSATNTTNSLSIKYRAGCYYILRTCFFNDAFGKCSIN
ncbi:hypothetical protein AAGW17_02595 [Rickettsia sp. Oklahoma-10]|uniref:Uncharacterized protein n=1 Tax=Rickettsia oklahomensis TaxID=3141789 RepID=A0AAU7BZX3_9RICK